MNFLWFFIQHCFICRPSDSYVSENAGIEPRRVAKNRRKIMTEEKEVLIERELV
jgi:hypothetical protein